MIGGVTRHILPHRSGVTYLHANRPLESKFLKCDLSLWGVVWSTYLSLDFIGEGWYNNIPKAMAAPRRPHKFVVHFLFPLQNQCLLNPGSYKSR